MGVISGIVGAGASIMQNQTNKHIAQMNNEYNEKMLDKQINYNKEAYQTQLGDAWKMYEAEKENQWNMWNATNEYNDPSAQRQRLEAAGLNPQLAIGSGNTASVVSGGSMSTPSQQGINPPTATPYSADYSGFVNSIAQAIELDNRTKLNDQQVENLKIENSYRGAKLAAEISQIIGSTKNDAVRVSLEKMLSNLNADLIRAQTDESKSRSVVNASTARLQTTQELMTNAQLQAFPEQVRMQLADQAANIAVKYAQKDLTKKQVEHECEKIAKTILEKDNVAYQNNQAAMNQQEQADTYDVRYNTLVATMKSAIYNSGIKEPTGMANYLMQLIDGYKPGSSFGTDNKYRYK